MAWANTNALKTAATVAWADETRAAIATDEGITTSNGTTGQVITLNAAVSTVDDYAVELDWQEDPGPNAGYLYVTKTTTNFTICNSGTTTGKKIHYRARLVVSL